ncbi:type I-B CRISPR-associated protein Cas5b [Methanobacterium sp. MBAC-LM]|uniref:type I-B CRISPR-associated protein Cas5b n=1 Tax=Methanobacterium sp. MBAC-LM TaxID=3412034 RepID=UPI003C74C31B
MEKVTLLEIFQPFAQYRNPFTFYYAQTYPLPPKSTVIGMLQNITGRYYDENFHDIKVSIHGGFESFFWNYQSLIKGAKHGINLMKYKGEVKLWNQGFPLYGSGITSQRSPVFQQELFNGHLYIFLKGKENLIEEIEKSLLNPCKIPYIGRSEDIIFLRGVYSEEDFFFSEKIAKKNIWLTQPAYVKLKADNDSKREFPIKNEKFPVYSIPLKVIFKNGEDSITNKAEITKSTKRVPEFETVMYTGSDQVIFLKDQVKVENYSIKDKNLTFKIPKEFGWL